MKPGILVFILLSALFITACHINEEEFPDTDVTISGKPELDISSANIMVSVTRDSTSDTILSINSTGGEIQGISSEVNYNTATEAWLEATLSGTSTPASLSLQFDGAGLEIGVYTATVLISASAFELQEEIMVEMQVNAPPFSTILLGKWEQCKECRVDGESMIDCSADLPPLHTELLFEEEGGGITTIDGEQELMEWSISGDRLSITTDSGTSEYEIRLSSACEEEADKMSLIYEDEMGTLKGKNYFRVD